MPLIAMQATIYPEYSASVSRCHYNFGYYIPKRNNRTHKARAYCGVSNVMLVSAPNFL